MRIKNPELITIDPETGKYLYEASEAGATIQKEFEPFNDIGCLAVQSGKEGISFETYADATAILVEDQIKHLHCLLGDWLYRYGWEQAQQRTPEIYVLVFNKEKCADDVVAVKIYVGAWQASLHLKTNAADNRMNEIMLRESFNCAVDEERLKPHEYEAFASQVKEAIDFHVKHAHKS